MSSSSSRHDLVIVARGRRRSGDGAAPRSRRRSGPPSAMTRRLPHRPRVGFRTQRFQQRAQFQPRVQLAQPRHVRRAGSQLFGADLSAKCGIDGGKLARQLQQLEFVAQIFADLAADVGGVRDQRVERLILIQPLRRGLRPHSGDAGNIVGAVADQGQVVDDLLGKHIELGFDAGAIEARVAHGIEQLNMRPHQLRHVLVAGGDQHLDSPPPPPAWPRCRSHRPLRRRERAAAAVPWRAPHLQRLNLCPQIIRHGRAMRLVLIEQIIAKGAAGRIEHHGDAIAALLP